MNDTPEPNIKRIKRGELTSREIVDVIEGGGRVIIEMGILGHTTNVVIRSQGGVYYCDTPMKLLRHENSEDLTRCLERYRLAPPTVSDQSRSVGTSA